MQPVAHDGRPLPLITPIAKPFFDAARRGNLLLQHCPRDGFFFYPRSRCPGCLGADWSWQPARASGRIYSFTIDRLGHDPGLRAQAPFAIAVVELDDGPRVIGNVVDAAFERLQIGLPVSVGFKLIEGAALMIFRLTDP
jgi:uncharacterized OB-fold protein